MNRRSFLKELAGSLTETAKQIASPFIDEDVRKITQAADLLQDMHWYRLDRVPNGYSESFRAGQAVCLYKAGEKITACRKICPDCRGMLQWIAPLQRLTCLSCDQFYTFAKQEGSLHPEFIQLKHEGDQVWAALPNKGAGDHA
ncbi:Rieske (2Fe-2S) protein [Sporolactobacillus sp. Y61]|uniref:Rieske (2Fe-2S) protein n=1 Tax=Sporolactobacillus sp. Y61 TaxID=3160863 RepID=A0AAU8IBT8_9BACL